MSHQTRNRALPMVMLVAVVFGFLLHAWWLVAVVAVVVGLGYAFGPKPAGAGRDRSARHAARTARRA